MNISLEIAFSYKKWRPREENGKEILREITKRPVKLPLAPQIWLLLPRVEWRFKSSIAPSVKIVVVSLHMWASISGSVSGAGYGPRIVSMRKHQQLGNSHQLSVKRDLVSSRELLTSKCSVRLDIPDL